MHPSDDREETSGDLLPREAATGRSRAGAPEGTPDAERPAFSTETMRSDLRDYLADLAVYRMPFGRFRNRRIQSLPYEYLHWFIEKGDGFPSGRLGELMEFVYHTKSVGAETIFSGLPKG